MAADFRVFLSAVTSEFGRARDGVANDLQARDLQLRVQRSFRQEPGSDTLLRLLHDYIRDCSAVVCVIGTRSGACPSPAAAAAFAHLLPPGITEASYTQWEFFFARVHKRRLSLYIADSDHRPDQGQPSGDDFSELQAAFLDHIKAEGLHYVPFSNRDQLRAEVLKEPWPEKPRPKPIVLPYASLGSLFKGREAFLRRLRESLTRPDGGTTAIVSKALYGLGGIGKTRAAVEYAWAHRGDYTALLFVQAGSPEELRHNLAGLAGPLLLAEREAADEEVRLNGVLGWLGANPSWLLILDNHAVAATWQTSVDQLTESGRRLLERLAYLAPDPVPMFLLDVAVPDSEGEDLHDGLADLAGVSLATRNPEGERFSVHRLVQDVTGRSLDATLSRLRVTEALGWVNAAFTGDPQDVRAWLRLDPLASHAQRVTQLADAARIAEPTARLMN